MRKNNSLFNRKRFDDFDSFSRPTTVLQENTGDDLTKIADRELIVNDNNELMIRKGNRIEKVSGQSITGKDGKDGTPGGSGAAGNSAYVYIAYASDASGTDFTMTFNSALDYIAILAADTEIETPSASDFTGLWKKYKGEIGQSIHHSEFTSTTAVSGLPNEPGETDTYTVWGDAGETINLGTFTVYNGDDGTDGTDGSDGASAFVYIAYASDDTGTDFTTTFDPDLDYIAILATTTEIVSPIASDFTGLWKNYKGAAGAGGGGGVTYVIKATDEAKSSNATPADDNTLKFTTTANTKYMIIMFIGYTIATSSTLKYLFNHTGTTTSWRILELSLQDDYGGDLRYNLTNIASTYTRTNANNNGRLVVGAALLDVGASGGTFSIQWSQNTSNTGATTFRAGSYLIYKSL